MPKPNFRCLLKILHHRGIVDMHLLPEKPIIPQRHNQKRPQVLTAICFPTSVFFKQPFDEFFPKKILFHQA
jgi:hypothetical protein